MIFDEACWIKGRVGPPAVGFWESKKIYEWSNDNSAEIEKGWFYKADTICDLVTKTSLDAAKLQETIKSYNKFCTVGKDNDFNRDPKGLIPVSTLPSYCSELTISIFQTFGQPVHNSIAQFLDRDKKPIPQLYAAGEFGSLMGYLYQSGAGTHENVGFGLIAGREDAALKPWRKSI
jgi:hypothetical protein